MPESVENSPHPGLRPGRVISPGTPRQLGTFGLFPPSSAQRRTMTVADTPLEVKSAEADLLWVGFRHLVDGAASPADFAGLAEQFGVWVVDDVPSTPEGASGSAHDSASSSAKWQRFSEVADVLFQADVTLFLVGALPPDFGPDSPLSLLLRVEAADDAAAEYVSGS
jgi:hypothetical protein